MKQLFPSAPLMLAAASLTAALPSPAGWVLVCGDTPMGKPLV